MRNFQKGFFMRQTLKLCFITMLFTLLSAFSSLASGSGTGHLDFFDESGISGWFYETSRPAESASFSIRLSNAVTGETVQEIPMTSSLPRPDLEGKTGSGSTPGFYTSINWNSLGDGLYTASIVSGGKTVGNALSHYSGSKGSETGLPEGVSSVQSLGSFRITGYCACRKCSAGWGGRTSSGTMAVSRRTVAVDPKVIPMGSRLLINGQVYTAEDTGGGVKGNHIDIYCDSHAQAKSLPFQSAQVFLLR